MTANISVMATYSQLWHTAAAQLPDNAITSAILATALVMLLVPRLRKLVWDTMETILASLLLVLLVLVVLGLPFGKCSVSHLPAHTQCMCDIRIITPSCSTCKPTSCPFYHYGLAAANWIAAGCGWNGTICHGVAGLKILGCCLQHE